MQKLIDDDTKKSARMALKANLRSNKNSVSLSAKNATASGTNVFKSRHLSHVVTAK